MFYCTTVKETKGHAVYCDSYFLFSFLQSSIILYYSVLLIKSLCLILLFIFFVCFKSVSVNSTSCLSGFYHFLHVLKGLDRGHKDKSDYPDCFLFLLSDNVELILKDIGRRLGSESQEPEQPDYDSVASDEDAEREPGSGKDERTKVCFSYRYSCGESGSALRGHTV